MGGLGATHELAFGQGARVSAGVLTGLERGACSAPARDREGRAARGRAPAVLRRHDARLASNWSLSHAEVRRLHRSGHYPSPSRFLGKSRAIDTRKSAPPARRRGLFAAGINIGYHRRHAPGLPCAPRDCGEGVVLYCKGQAAMPGYRSILRVWATEWLVLGYARLQQM